MMNSSSKTRVLIATLLAGAAAASASAQTNSNPQPYMGANVSLYSKYDLRCDSGVHCDRKADLGGKIFGGYQFEQFGVEALAFGLKSGQGSLKNGNAYEAGSLSQSGLGVVGVLPISEGPFTFKGKLGLAYVRGKASLASGVQDKSSVQPLIGAGVSYAINKQVSINADWDRFQAKYNNGGKSHANMLSMGVSYAF